MKTIIVQILFFLIISCNNSKDNKESKNNINTKNTIEEKIFWEIPNAETKTETISTIDNKDNDVLFSKFLSDLKREKFKIENIELNIERSYNDCNRNIILTVEGKGIRKYYIKRQKDKPKNYYPDFVLWVYEFENEETAKTAKTKILAALKSGRRFCNGKSPENIIRNKNEVFQLGTRAEMFRGYINDFGEKIKNYR